LLAEFFKRRKKQLAAKRVEAIRNKPPTKTQLRNLMITYLKNMGGYKHSQLKVKSYEEIQEVDQESQIKMIQVKEMMQDNDLKNSKSKDKGSRSRSQSMNDQSHYKQDKTKTRQSINVKSHIFNVIGSTEEFEERDLNIGGDC
ncbi:hypothetical protein Tco_1469887, partial [Tanacetum coccineum]